MSRKFNWDALGITTAIACAIHCAVLPLLFTSLPLLGIDFIKDKFFEYGMIGLAFLIGMIAFWHGYRKHHHTFYPIGFFTAGFIFLVVKEYSDTIEMPFLFIAVGLILTAHYLNYRLCRRHNHGHREDCDH